MIPKNSVVYRTALNAPGVKSNASGDTIKIVALGGNAPGDTGSEVTLTAGADKFFPADGAASAMLGIVNGTAISTSADTAVQVITSANSTAEQNPSAGADRKSPLPSWLRSATTVPPLLLMQATLTFLTELKLVKAPDNQYQITRASPMRRFLCL